MAINLTDAQIRNLFPTYFEPSYTGQLNVDKIRKILNTYSDKIGGRTYIANELKVNQVVVGRIITRAIKQKIVKKVPLGQFTKTSQRKYTAENPRKIYKEVRPVEPRDYIKNPDIPKSAKFKAQVPSGAAGQSTKMVYGATEEIVKNKIKAADKFTETAKLEKAKPFKDAVKSIHRIAMADPEDLNSIKKLSKMVYGADDVKNLTKTANDLVRYQEFLLGFRPIAGISVPVGEKLDDIIAEFPASGQWGKFAAGAIRESKLKVRDQLLKTKGPKLIALRNTILKFVDSGAMELDEAMGVSATYERAPGYTELGQVIKKGINQAKRTEIDNPFSRLFEKVIAGETNPTIMHNKTEIGIKEFNKLSREFQKINKVDTPIIEFKPGEVLDPSKFVKHFDKLSPEARANVTQLAEKGIGLRSRAMPMIEMLYGIYKTANPGEKSIIQRALGCTPGAASGGRIGFATGTLDACVNTKLKNQTLESGQKIVTGIEEGATGVLGKFRNVAKGFLGALGKFGPAVGKFGAIAAAGAIAQPLVKQFRNDDPYTYLTDPDQQAGMLEALIEEERPKPRSEALDLAHTAGTVGATAAVIPGSGRMYDYRRGLSEAKIPKAGPVSKAGLTAGDYLSRHKLKLLGGEGRGAAPQYGKIRAGAGVGMKLLSGMFTPAGILATEPLRIAQMRREGESWGEIAKSPTLWMGPAFADTMTRIATSGMKPSSRLAKALSLGMSRPMLKTVSRRFGMPGLALSAGLSGYDLWQDYKKKRGFFARDEE